MHGGIRLGAVLAIDGMAYGVWKEADSAGNVEAKIVCCFAVLNDAPCGVGV